MPVAGNTMTMEGAPRTARLRKGSDMYERILVGTDGSRQALDAISRAGELAKLCGVTQLHVVAACHPYSPAELARIEADLPEEFHDLVVMSTPAVGRFDQARTILGKMGIDVVEYEAAGSPSHAILDAAEQIDADLIVVGARGLGAIGRFIRGSVSTRVAHHAPCDVLIVEHDD